MAVRAAMPVVLVVTRSPKMREILGTALRLDGHAVAEAAEGAAAWRLLEKEPVTAAIIDLESLGPDVSDGSGLSGLVPRIRADERLKELPVVAVVRDSQSERAALEAGADRVVQTASPIGAIREAVEGAIAERVG